MRATGKGLATTSSRTPPVSGKSWNETASPLSGASCTLSIRRTGLWTSLSRFTKSGPCSTECSLSFATATTPASNNSLDEGMIPTKNLLAIKQFIRGKPVRWDIKSFQLCEAKTGYILDAEIYTGRVKDRHLPHPRISWQCCPPSRGELAGHHMLFMDRFYNSVALFHLLKNELGVLAAGTAMPSCKHYPKEFGRRLTEPAVTNFGAGELCVPSPGRTASPSTS